MSNGFTEEINVKVDMKVYIQFKTFALKYNVVKEKIMKGCLSFPKCAFSV